MHHSIRPAALGRWAGVLLVVLLSHLALMASPLHAAAMDPDHGAMAEMTTIMDGDLSSMPPGLCPASSINCMIEWASPASEPSIQALLGPPLPDWLLPRPGDALVPAPSPQTLGPPQLVDAQALLQVFRI